MYHADFVIVGIGAAGSLMASELSNPKYGYSVIGLEAGPNASKERAIRDSLFAGVEFGLEDNFDPVYLYQQTPTRNGALGVSGGVKAQCNLIGVPGITPDTGQPEKVGIYSTGRVLGGGSSINGEQYVRGTSGVYSLWEQIGGEQWNPERVAYLYKHLEQYEGESADGVHGEHGDLAIRQAPNVPTVMASKVTQAISEALNLPQIPFDDYNNPSTPIGPFNKWELFQFPSGARASGDAAFLSSKVMNEDGEGRGNRKLKVFCKATVLKIIWDRAKAIGVTALIDNEFVQVCARKKVILCAGIYSAQILQRSGVGPEPLLKCLGIPVIYDSPNVGRNLTNHLILPIIFSANPADPGLPENDPRALYTGGAFLPPLLPEDDMGRRGYQIIGASTAPGMYMMIIIYLQPHSRGQIRIKNTDALDISLVDDNYFGNPLDIQAFMRAVREYIVPISQKLAQIDPSYQLQSPTLDQINDDAKLKDYIDRNFDHTHHWMSSNRMAQSPEEGVVDGCGHVFGVKGLVVADDSIAPVINDGNTNGPAYVIAKTISRILLG